MAIFLCESYDQTKVMIWLLFNIALVVFPLGNILRFDIGGGIAILALDVITGIIFVMSLLHLFKHRSQLLSDRAFQFFIGFVGICILGLIINASWLSSLQIFISSLYLVRFIIYGSLLWIVGMLSSAKQSLLFKRLLISGLTAVVLGLAQYFLYPDLRNVFYLGWDEHLYRLFGTYFDPNFAGALFVIILGTLYKAKILYRWSTKPIIFVGSITVAAILLTYSRGTYIMFLITGLTYAVISKKPRFILMLILVCIIGFLVLPRDIASEGVDLLRTGSVTRRIAEYQEAMQIAKSSPIIGTGFNAYRYAQLKHGFLDLDHLYPNHAGAGIPNSFLFVLATTGIVGLILYMLLWLSIIYKRFKKKDFIIVAVCIGLLAHAMFENSLFYPYIMFITFNLLATSGTLSRRQSKDRPQKS